METFLTKKTTTINFKIWLVYYDRFYHYFFGSFNVKYENLYLGKGRTGRMRQN